MIANWTIRDLTVPMLLLAGLLGGCAASQTMLAKKDLVVQAKTSTAVFVEPVTLRRIRFPSAANPRLTDARQRSTQ